MRYALRLSCALISAAFLTGCDNSSSTPAPAGSGSTAAPAPEAADKAASEATATAPADAGAVKELKHDAAATTQPAGASAAASDATVSQAQQLLDQATTYIKENKMDLAEKTITQLEGLKPKLPAEWASKIDSARSAFNTAKAGSSKLNGLIPK